MLGERGEHRCRTPASWRGTSEGERENGCGRKPRWTGGRFHCRWGGYGLRVDQVKEIIRLIPITRVPNSPERIEGVINLRGNVVPVVNLHKRLGLGERVNSQRSRVIIVCTQDVTAGIVVDSVKEVLDLPAGHIEPPLTGKKETSHLSGIGKSSGRVIMLLDLEKIDGKSCPSDCQQDSNRGQFISGIPKKETGAGWADFGQVLAQHLSENREVGSGGMREVEGIGSANANKALSPLTSHLSPLKWQALLMMCSRCRQELRYRSGVIESSGLSGIGLQPR